MRGNSHVRFLGEKGAAMPLTYPISTPELFKQHVKSIINIVRNKPSEDQIVFLKSWNEWGEGNYMEPDLKYGKGYINALREALEEIE